MEALAFEKPAPAIDEALRFVLELGQVLHQYGTPAHRLEEALVQVCRRLGLEARVFASPTAIFIAFDGQVSRGTHLIRTDPGEVDLEKLVRADEITRGVIAGTLSPAAARRRLEALVQARPRYGPALTLACFGLVSAGAGRFLGGGAVELALAGLAGLVVGALAVGSGRLPALGRVLEAVAALAVSILAITATAVVGPVAVETVILSALIVLLPGLTLTIAMNELATRNLVAGTARLAGASLSFIQLGFGVAVGYQLGELALGPGFSAPPVALPEWTIWPALLVAPLTFTVLFRARPRDVGWILAAGVIAFLGARLGTQALGPQLGVFVGAFLVGIGSNLRARFLNQPAAVTMVPGIMLLVPGSFGFRSVSSLLERDVFSGVESAFTMLLVAVALVAGLLFANVVVSPRKAL